MPTREEAPSKKKDAATKAPLSTMYGLTVCFLLASHTTPQMGDAIELAPSLTPNSRPTSTGDSLN